VFFIHGRIPVVRLAGDRGAGMAAERALRTLPNDPLREGAGGWTKRPIVCGIARSSGAGEDRMSQLTVYLARLIGLFIVLLIAALLLHGGAMIETAVADKPLMFTYAIISLALGIAMVLGHNVWAGGALPVVVSVVGWLILAKGLLLLFLAPEALAGIFGRMQYGEHLYLYLTPSLVLGLYLTWAGFTAPSPYRS
jgi:hypothetical protein